MVQFIINQIKKPAEVKSMSFLQKRDYGTDLATQVLDYYCSLHGLEWRMSSNREDISGIDAVLSNGMTVQVKTTNHHLGNIMIKQFYLDTQTKATYHPDNINADLFLLLNPYGIFEFSKDRICSILREINNQDYSLFTRSNQGSGWDIEGSYCDLYRYDDDREKTKTGQKRPVLHARINYKLGTIVE